MTSDRMHRLEGRLLFIRRLPTILPRARRRVTSAVIAVAVVLGAAGALPWSIGAVGLARGVPAGVLGAVAAAGLALYVSGRAFLVSDVRRLVEPPWSHDGIVERHTGPAAIPVPAALRGPLLQAAEAATVRAGWAVVIGTGQCVVGAATLGMAALLLPMTPWIVLLTTFVIGGLGQDMAFRALPRIAMAAEAARAADAAGADATRNGPADAIARVRDPGRNGSTASPRLPHAGRGSSLALPGE